MEIFAIINLVLTLGAMVVYGVVTFKKTGTRPEAVTSGASHTLVRVWENMAVVHDRKGWWMECSCGLSCPATATGDKSYGSERSAIDTFKTHTSLHTGLVALAVNPFEKKYSDEVAAFTAYRNACYCKDTNDDLLVLKHRHP